MRSLLTRRTAPTHLFLAGAVIIVAFLLHNMAVLKAAQLMLFGTLAVAAGRRVRWPYFLVLICTIVIFHLLSPHGKILLTLGPLNVTDGALRQGLIKGLTVTGLVLVSLFSVRRDLVLPGRAGREIADVLYYYERLLEGRRNRFGRTAGDTRLTVRQITQRVTQGIDEVLFEVYPPEAPATPGPHNGKAPIRTTAGGYVFLIALVALNCLPAILRFTLRGT